MNALFKKIELLLLDVDGVLTDGQIIYTDRGEQIKAFDSKDGLGLRLLMDHGIQVGIITGRKSNALISRCHNLGIDIIFDGITDKAAALETIIQKYTIPCEHIAFMGDDLPDLPVMRKAGIGISVSDADETVRQHADYVTMQKGGKGAVREVCEAILKAKNLWDKILGSYLP